MDSEEGTNQQHQPRCRFRRRGGGFEDPRALTVDDPHPDEQRFVTVGLDFLGRVLVVCWTPRDDDIRIFSARKATPAERDSYSEGE